MAFWLHKVRLFSQKLKVCLIFNLFQNQFQS